MYPVVETTHVLIITVFFGLTAFWDLRLLGMALGRVPVSDVGSRLLPWAVGGFVLSVVTGVLLVYSNPIAGHPQYLLPGQDSPGDPRRVEHPAVSHGHLSQGCTVGSRQDCAQTSQGGRVLVPPALGRRRHLGPDDRVRLVRLPQAGADRPGPILFGLSGRSSVGRGPARRSTTDVTPVLRMV